jgi:hypothetical protein
VCSRSPPQTRALKRHRAPARTNCWVDPTLCLVVRSNKRRTLRESRWVAACRNRATHPGSPDWDALGLAAERRPSEFCIPHIRWAGAGDEHPGRRTALVSVPLLGKNRAGRALRPLQRERLSLPSPRCDCGKGRLRKSFRGNSPRPPRQLGSRGLTFVEASRCNSACFAQSRRWGRTSRARLS